MDWEVVSGITGIISAACALISLIYFSSNTAKSKYDINTPILNQHLIFSFLLASSGWALCCTCYMWIAEPYGRYPRPYEYLQMLGIILALPSVIILLFGLKRLNKHVT